MTGAEMKEWRRRNGYTQDQLLKELEIKSRQTISNWECAERVERLVELALIALEMHPERRNILGIERRDARRKRNTDVPPQEAE